MIKQFIVKLRTIKSKAIDPFEDIIQVNSDCSTNSYAIYQEFYYQNQWWQLVICELAYFLKTILLGKNNYLSKKVITNSCLSR
ncbi:MAG: hypothetical protein GF308_10105 [Candidatus Heimdallarchaeota archaeon]|nr:hypothetical protein [Candidatus Heimdallarchaeota archaeon]